MKFLIPTIYNNQNSFFISLILDRTERILEFVHDFRLPTRHATWLCFLKELSALQLPYPLYSDGHCARFYLVLSPRRFRRDCKGRNLSGTSKKLCEVFFLFPSGFPRLTPVKPFFFHGCFFRSNRPSLAEWCKDRKFINKVPSLLFIIFRYRT